MMPAPTMDNDTTKRRIRPLQRYRNLRGTVTVPGSKSYTHRYLIAAALSRDVCEIVNPLASEDTLLTAGALERLGAVCEKNEGRWKVHGRQGRWIEAVAPLDLGNSGTSMRLLTAVAALGGGGVYRLTGSHRLCQRPLGALVDALRQAGVNLREVHGNGCPPVDVRGGGIPGGRIVLDCSRSSQFLSALLLAAPCSRAGLDIHIAAGPVSRPYVDMTVAVMEEFGIRMQRQGYSRFEVPGGQVYRGARHRVEPDFSQAAYFWTAAAITGGAVKVEGTHRRSYQGDRGLLDVLTRMGCRVAEDSDGIEVKGPERLKAVEAAMGDMPDVVPTLAVAAAFAEGLTVIRDVAHLRDKESDRITAVLQELGRMGVEAGCTADMLTVRGGRPRGAAIQTYQDHRIAMSFALAGLRVDGVTIVEPACVAKSFPGFWHVLEGLAGR